MSLEFEKGFPVRASQTFAVPSLFLVARRGPSGLNATLLTSRVCPLSSNRVAPVRGSQTFAVLSQPAVSTRVPSGPNATLPPGDDPSKNLLVKEKGTTRRF